MKNGDTFRASGGSVFHIFAGYERASFGTLKYKTACGKSYFPGEKLLRGHKKTCAQCKAAQLRVERTAEIESENDVNAAEDGGVVQQDMVTVNREELIALLEATISRGESLGYMFADADYKEWLSRVRGYRPTKRVPDVWRAATSERKSDGKEIHAHHKER